MSKTISRNQNPAWYRDGRVVLVALLMLQVVPFVAVFVSTLPPLLRARGDVKMYYRYAQHFATSIAVPRFRHGVSTAVRDAPNITCLILKVHKAALRF